MSIAREWLALVVKSARETDLFMEKLVVLGERPLLRYSGHLFAQILAI